MFVRSTVHLNRTRQEKINASSKAITDHGFAIMQNPLIIGLIVFGVISAGAFVGLVIKERLPKHHLNDETKNTVTVSMAVVATFSALVLGLLISNANTSFSALGGEVTTLSAQILRLDQLLRRYGPETGSARDGQGTPKAFVALLVFWLTLLFASFGLFAPRNLTSAATLTLCALAVAGAIGMILELERGFGGLVHISPQPMRQAVYALQTEREAELYE